MDSVLVKNKSESIHVAASDFRGMDLIDVRIHAELKNGDIVPTKKGISLNREQLPAFIEALQKV